MDEAEKKWEFPGAAWLRARLGRKLILVLLVLAVLGWAVSFWWVLSDLRDYIGGRFDTAAEHAQTAAERISSYLAGSRGDTGALSEYLAQNGIACRITDENGETVFEYFPALPAEQTLTMSAGAMATASDGTPLTIRAYVGAERRSELTESFGQRAFWTLSIFNALLLVAAGLLLNLLIVHPVVDLRAMMRRYLEDGTLPEKSRRRDEIGRLQNAFAQLAGVVQAKEQSERRLIASISHDIKTPLTAVMGFSQRLLTEDLPAEKQHQYAEGIHDRALAMKSVVDAFDDYLESGLRGNAPMEVMTAKALCDSVEREFALELEEVGAAFTVRCLCPEAKIIGSAAQLRRYFGNLIGNSLSHGGKEHPALTLTCSADDGNVVLAFSDNGCGVPQELLQKIFEPLYTGDRGRKVSGLGLAICRSIIRAHGGSVTAENVPTGGLCIRAVLPQAHAG